MHRKTLKALAAGLTAAALASAPASAVLDEGGGAATSSDPTVQVGRFDWNDAGIGIGIGAAAGAMVVGTALIVRRHRIAPRRGPPGRSLGGGERPMRDGCLTRLLRAGVGARRAGPPARRSRPATDEGVVMSRSLSSVAAAVAALAVTLSACGSGNKNQEESESPPTTKKQDTAEVTTEPEPITAAEEHWLAQIKRYGDRLEDEFARPGTITHATMRRRARLYLNCEADAGTCGRPGQVRAPQASSPSGATNASRTLRSSSSRR